MKKVLAELHQLINSLEDHGLTAEASSLQEVFVRVAQKADPNDLSEKVTDLLGKYSAPELIAALAEQMDSKDTKTMSFAYGDEPDEFTESERQLGTEKNPLYKGVEGPNRMWKGHPISEMSRWNLPRQDEPAPYKERAHVIMNEFIGQAIKGDMDPDDAYFRMNQRLESNERGTISKPQFDTYVKNKSVINPNLSTRIDQIVAPPLTPEIREQMKKDWDEMTERHKKMPYGSPAHQTSR